MTCTLGLAVERFQACNGVGTR